MVDVGVAVTVGSWPCGGPPSGDGAGSRVAAGAGFLTAGGGWTGFGAGAMGFTMIAVAGGRLTGCVATGAGGFTTFGVG